MFNNYLIKLMLLFLIIPNSIVWSTNFHGVCVGINDYPGSINDLSCCVADAEDMKRTLENEQGWSSTNIELLTDSYASESNIQSKIQNMTRNEGNTDLFHFAGHGDSEELEGSDGLIPANSISARIKPSELKSWFDSSYNQYCCFLDACGTGIFPRDISNGVISSACKADEYAKEGHEGHGYFTFYLIEGLNNNTADSDGIVSAEELHAYAAPKTTNLNPNQHPQISDNYPGVLNFTPPITAGTLIDDENWSGTHDLTGNVDVPTDITLTIDDGTTINLNGYYLKSTDGTITNNGTINPDNIQITESDHILGYYSSISSATNNASSGQQVNVAAGTYNEGSITVPYNVTLKIYPDVTLRFSNSKTLKVYGALKAVGESSYPITFTKSGSASWYGIKFEDSSSNSESILEYCDIENASYGVYCDRANPYRIKRCNIENVIYGIFCYYATGSSYKIDRNKISDTSLRGILFHHSYYQIKNNRICDSQEIGIHLDGGSHCTIARNKVYDNYSRGIYLRQSSPNLDDNKITENSHGGIYCHDYSNPNLSFYGSNNIIAENGEHGIYVDVNSRPSIGYTSGSSENSIYDNSDKQVYSQQSDLVYAKYNWWGTSSPGSNEIQGNVDYTPYLTSDPNDPLSAMSKMLAQNFIENQQNTSPNDFNNANEHYNKGYLYEISEEYTSAISEYEYVVANYPAAVEAEMCLVGLTRCYEKTGRKGNITSYMQNVAVTEKSNSLSKKALELAALYYVGSGEVEKAINNYSQLSSQLSNIDMAKNALYSMWQIHFNITKNSKEAQSIMERYEKSYNMDDNLMFMKVASGEITLENIKNVQRSGRVQPRTTKNKIPQSFRLFDNYPNPFNPTTQIKYAVNKAGNVKVVIYNILGKEIKTLVNEYTSAGNYSVTWNGCNNFGKKVTSGMYFYRLQAGDLQVTKKMLMTK